MHLNHKLRLLIVFIAIISFSSCKVTVDNDVTPTDPNANAPRSASYVIGGSTKETVAKPYDGIFTNNSTVNNMVTLDSPDGSEITFSFVGTKATTIPLVKYPDAVYKSPTGETFNVTSGSLIITSYNGDNNSTAYSFSGTFSFNATSLSNSQHTVVITGGVITNCSNAF